VRPFGVVREQLEAMLEGAGVHVEDAPLVHDSLLIQPGVSLTELGAFRQGLFFVQDPAATLVTKYAGDPPGATWATCAPPRREDGGARARRGGGGEHGPLARPPAARCSPTLQRLEVRNVFPARERRARAGAPPARRGARGRALHRDGHLPPAPRRALAPAHQRHRRDGGAPARDPARRRRRWCARAGCSCYSTCSLEPEENDAQIESFLAEHPEWRLEPPPEGSVPAHVLDAGRLRVLPQRHGADGSFAARLRRTA
jgi:16S rRNA (cytosine967-C5)-methyltransferase